MMQTPPILTPPMIQAPPTIQTGWELQTSVEHKPGRYRQNQEFCWDCGVHDVPHIKAVLHERQKRVYCYENVVNKVSKTTMHL